MSRIRGKDTRPELMVRQLLHAMGYRFRLHRRDLPGTPDIVLPSRRKIIEVRGCYWHGHEGCPFAYVPKTRRDFWVAKIGRNRERDARNLGALLAIGWKVEVVWECEIQSGPRLTKRLSTFLGPPSSDASRAKRSSPQPRAC